MVDPAVANNIDLFSLENIQVEIKILCCFTYIKWWISLFRISIMEYHRHHQFVLYQKNYWLIKKQPRANMPHKILSDP